MMADIAQGHSHDLGQYPDGLRGSLIFHDPFDPFGSEYDEEYLLTITDWYAMQSEDPGLYLPMTHRNKYRYHEQAVALGDQMLQPSNTAFAPPIPDAMLLNDGQRSDYAFDRTKTYRFRIISFAALTSFMINFKSLPMTVIMNDASYINSEEVNQLRLAPGQRYDVLIHGSVAADGENYPFLISMDGNPDYTT
jgi:iron transport multicopper oxidase